MLSFYPAWVGRTSWWLPGIAFALFLVFVLEPWLLTWELRRRGEELQITDEGVLRRLARGDSEYVRWGDLREVSIVMTQGVNLTEEYFFVLAGAGTSGVLVGQELATQPRPAVAPDQTTRLRSSQHRDGHGVAGESALHAVARRAARRRGQRDRRGCRWADERRSCGCTSSTGFRTCCRPCA